MIVLAVYVWFTSCFIEEELKLIGVLVWSVRKRNDAAKLPDTSLTLSPPVAARYLSKFFKVIFALPPWPLPLDVTTASPIVTCVAGSTNC